MSVAPAYRPPSVLIVDGQARASNSLARLLREDGCQVEVLTDGKSALARLGNSPPIEALITELSLPALDGAAVARFARTQNPGMSIVVLTRHPNLLDTAQFGEKAPTVLTKPLDYARLLEVLGMEPATPSAAVRLASPRF